jgi:hypothetical protein
MNVEGHPALGLAPMDMTAGFPAAAAQLRSEAESVAERALGAARDGKGGLRGTYDEFELRRLVRDTRLMVDRLADTLASGQAVLMTQYADWCVPVYRRRRVSLLDMALLCDGIEKALDGRFSPDEAVLIDESLDGAAEIFRWHSRLGGDTHKRNALSKWLYRGI